MRERINRGTAAVLLAAVLLPLGAAVPAQARHRRHSNSRENTWRIGTYAGTGATAYALAHGNLGWGLVGAGATYLSYQQWKKEVRRRHQRDYSYGRYRRYRRAYYRHHHRRR
jgi:hypothetical protein